MRPSAAEAPLPTRNTRAPKLWLGMIAACALAALAALAVGAWRLASVEQRELDVESKGLSLRAAQSLPTATRLSGRLYELQLKRDQRAIFELCAPADLAGPAFRDAFELLILQADAGKLMLRVPLDAAHVAHVQGDARASCLLLGSGVIEQSGNYHIEAVWPSHAPPEAILDTTLWVHVQASPVLTRIDLITVCVLGIAILLGLMLALRIAPAHDVSSREARQSIPPRHEHPAYALVPLVAVALMYLAMRFPSSGGLQTLLKGCVLLALQTAVPFFFVRQTSLMDKPSALGLTGVRRPAVSALLVVISVPLLVASARVSMRVVPSTEVAPIQHFIAMPSGMLSAALLGAILPLGEELLFRGYLLGAWLRYGKAVAAIASVLVFGLMHLEQSWGNWGGLLAIFLTGSVLCGLRLATGSCLVSAISHVAYNLTLSVSSLAAAVSS